MLYTFHWHLDYSAVLFFFILPFSERDGRNYGLGFMGPPGPPGPKGRLPQWL